MSTSAPRDLAFPHAAGPAALRGSVLRSSAYAATVGLSLISAPLLIRHLGIAEFGRYATVLAIVTIVGGLADAGVLNVALREWATQGTEGRPHLMRTLLGVRIELSVVAVAVGVGMAVVGGYGYTLVVGTLLAGVGYALQTTANLLTVTLLGDLRFGWASIIDVARQVVSVALIVVLVFAGAGLLPFFAATIPAGLVTLVFTATLVRSRIPLLPRFRGADGWRLVRASLPFAAAIAVHTVYFRVTIVVMSLTAAARQTGYFATSFRVIEVLIGIPALAVASAFPILARAAGDDLKRFAYASSRILELALVAGTGLVLAVVLSAPFIIDVLAGASGAPAAPVLQIQGLALSATFVATASAYCLLSLRLYAALLRATAGALVTNVVLTLVLVSVAGARGAAFAALGAESCLAIVLLILLVRAGHTRVTPSLMRAVALAGLAGATPLLVPGLHPVIRTMLGLGIYMAALALQRSLPPEIMHVIRPESLSDRAMAEAVPGHQAQSAHGAAVPPQNSSPSAPSTDSPTP